MCQTTIGRVIAVEGGVAQVDVGGQRRQAIALSIPDLLPGELVLVGLGTVLGRVDADDAAALAFLTSSLDDTTTDEAPAPPRTTTTTPTRRT
jgi:hydrogenase maturation factor